MKFVVNDTEHHFPFFLNTLESVRENDFPLTRFSSSFSFRGGSDVDASVRDGGREKLVEDEDREEDDKDGASCFVSRADVEAARDREFLLLPLWYGDKEKRGEVAGEVVAGAAVVVVVAPVVGVGVGVAVIVVGDGVSGAAAAVVDVVAVVAG